MAKSPRQRVQSNQRCSAKFKLWYRAYRSRMDEGYEHCRNRGCGNLATTFGHLVAAVHGGRYAPHNLTLLCPACNKKQGTRVWRWLVPLTDEVDFLEVVYGGSSGAGCDHGPGTRP